MRTCSSFRTSFRHIQRLRHARKRSPTVAPRPQMLPMLMTESNDRLPRSPLQFDTRKTNFYQNLLSRSTWNAMISTKINFYLPYINRRIVANYVKVSSCIMLDARSPAFCLHKDKSMSQQ